jgi:CheY-like chemotaxis protein
MESQKGKILVIEDDPASYKLIEAALKSTPCHLIHAENGEDAIKLFTSNKDIRMVLLDIQLPVMNGFEILSHMRKSNMDLPIIAQTAYSMSNDKEKCLKAGCTEYISKPINITKLRELVNKYLG